MKNLSNPILTLLLAMSGFSVTVGPSLAQSVSRPKFGSIFKDPRSPREPQAKPRQPDDIIPPRWFLDGGVGSLKRVTVEIKNYTKHKINFSAFSNVNGTLWKLNWVLQPGHAGSFSRMAGPVQYSYSWNSTISSSGGAGAGILENNRKYALVQTDSGVDFKIIGNIK